MKKTLQRGFTLIELLVVIAIIGILAAVVLASLNDARDSGSDASIQQSMSNARSQAEIRYNQDNFTYENVCADPKIVQLLNAAAATGQDADDAFDVDAGAGTTAGVCNDGPDDWVMWMPLATDGIGGWCVDSSGFAGRASSTVVASGTDLDCD